MSAPHVVDVYANAVGLFQYLHVFLSNGKMIAFDVNVLDRATLLDIMQWVDISALSDFIGVSLFDGPYDSMYLEMWSSPPPEVTHMVSHICGHTLAKEIENTLRKVLTGSRKC